MLNPQHTCGLYLISPESFILEEFVQQLKQAFSGGKIDVFQLRMKNTSDEKIIAACKVLIPICHANGAQFILNDRFDLVKKLGADGVHIGIEDGKIADARAAIGKNKVIGVSCYDDSDRAIDAAEQGADYVAFGAFYDTKTKIPRGRPQPEILKWWTQNSVIPCVAIGGIKYHNCEPLVKHGADFIAVVTAVWDDPEGAAHAVKKLNEAIQA
jgi:thiamine-phosphate pyrophosphorylase